MPTIKKHQESLTKVTKARTQLIIWANKYLTEWNVENLKVLEKEGEELREAYKKVLEEYDEDLASDVDTFLKETELV